MGFRNPITTVAGVDTGTGSQRVVITSTAGAEGGGAVLLYGAGADPGSLEAASGDSGPAVVLNSPPNLLGERSSIVLTGTDYGDEGVWISSTGRVYLNGEPYQRVRAWRFPRSDHTAAALTSWAANTWGAIIDRTIPGAPAGDYLITATSMMSSTSTTSGYAQLQINGVDYLQIPGSYARADLTSFAQLPYTYVVAYSHPGGDLRVTSWHFAISSAMQNTSAATFINVAHLGPRF